MVDSNEQPAPGRGFRLVTKDGKEKFLPIPMPLTKPADMFRIDTSEADAVPPMPLAQGAGQPPSEPPIAPPSAMEPMPEPEQGPVDNAAQIARLEIEHNDLLSALYWVQTQIAELKEKGGQ